MMDGGGMFFGGGFMWIFWIILFIVIIWGVKMAMDGGSKNSNNSNSTNSDSPMELLRKRYANGDIDEEEFNRRRKELEK
ncbi:MAG: SHOCT domain-containing protein [Gammaproteobacteria bacterium]